LDEWRVGLGNGGGGEGEEGGGGKKEGEEVAHFGLWRRCSDVSLLRGRSKAGLESRDCQYAQEIFNIISTTSPSHLQNTSKY
jgi:hypothetical protein